MEQAKLSDIVNISELNKNNHTIIDDKYIKSLTIDNLSDIGYFFLCKEDKTGIIPCDNVITYAYIRILKEVIEKNLCIFN